MIAERFDGFPPKIGVQFTPAFLRALRTACSIQLREGTQLIWRRRPLMVRVQPGWSM